MISPVNTKSGIIKGENRKLRKLYTIPESAKMDIKGFLKNTKEIAEGLRWDLKYIIDETLGKIKNSNKPNGASILGTSLLIAGGITLADYSKPPVIIAQEADSEPEHAAAEYVKCGLPKNADSTIRDRIMESKQYPFELVVKSGETIEEAIRAYATIYPARVKQNDNVINQRQQFIDEAVEFTTAMGYNIKLKYNGQCTVPICTTLEECNPEGLINKAKAGPIERENIPPAIKIELTEFEGATPEKHIEIRANQAPEVNAGADLAGIVNKSISITAQGNDPDNDPIKYTWKVISQPKRSGITLEGADSKKVSFTPDRPGQYVLRVTANDGKGGTAEDEIAVNAAPEPLSLMGRGMNPAAVFNYFNSGLFNYNNDKKARLQVEAGPLFGAAERTDNDTIEIRDPLNGTLLTTVSLEKVLEKDVSGFYADAFARIGDRTLLSLNIRNTAQKGDFSIDGQNVSDYEAQNLSVQLGLRRGIKEIKNFAITGDIFLGYNRITDSATDDYGTQKSDADMIGGGAGLGLAYRIDINNFQVVPGLGMAYHYFSGEGDDVRTVVLTKAGAYDMSFNDLITFSIDYRNRIETQSISEKEIDSELNTHSIGLQVMIGKKKMLGLEAEAIVAGSYKESFPGSAIDLDGNASGFSADLIGKYPLKWGSIGLRGGYEGINIDFDDGRGKKKEGISHAGVIVEW